MNNLVARANISAGTRIPVPLLEMLIRRPAEPDRGRSDRKAITASQLDDFVYPMCKAGGDLNVAATEFRPPEAAPGAPDLPVGVTKVLVRGARAVGSLGLVSGHLRRFAAIAAIFAVLFAPGVPTAAAPDDDLSAVVLAPTFETSELTAGRHADASPAVGCEVPPRCGDTVVASDPAAAVGESVEEMRVRPEGDLRRGTAHRRGPPRF